MANECVILYYPYINGDFSCNCQVVNTFLYNILIQILR